jgi:hypothetical protein
MQIRDSHSSVKGDFSTITMPSGGLDVIGEDGRTLYTIKLDGGKLSVSAGMVCKVEGVLLDDKLSIAPHSRNSVVIERPNYEPK